MKGPPDIAVHLVIPCYRESRRVGPFLTDLCEILSSLPLVRIQLVDDGSGPEEVGKLRQIVDARRADHPFVHELIALPENIGKGGTVYAGWEAHRGEPWLMFVDADGSVSAREVLRLIRLAHENGSLARAWFASRVVMLGRRVERMWYRDIMGQVFHWTVNLVLGLAAHDTQCGCKLVPRAMFEKARSSLSLHGFAFDLDLLLSLREQGCEVTEVPVDWHEVAGGKIRLLRDSCRMFADVWRLRRRHHPRPNG